MRDFVPVGVALVALEPEWVTAVSAACDDGGGCWGQRGGSAISSVVVRACFLLRRGVGGGA